MDPTLSDPTLSDLEYLQALQNIVDPTLSDLKYLQALQNILSTMYDIILFTIQSQQNYNLSFLSLAHK